ncbi:MAG: TetR/AcrR family transcriptional regulator [Rikenellaceae bacterium]|jgi:AcrR family transcriptional regulator|nr:TetR/AcrR family transcriptional regulator [Rikenellaceae bacterium]
MKKIDQKIWNLKKYTYIYREQEILDAAERLFLQKGYELTSTTEIAREAGCNQALVHYYHRTKEQLFVKVLSLNASLFVARPLAQAVMQLDDRQWEAMLARRREEHVRIIVNSLKP